MEEQLESIKQKLNSLEKELILVGEEYVSIKGVQLWQTADVSKAFIEAKERISHINSRIRYVHQELPF